MRIINAGDGLFPDVLSLNDYQNKRAINSPKKEQIQI